MLRIEGVFVLRVPPDSAAEQAGLVSARIAADGSFVPGDVIVAVDGKPVAGVGELLGRLDDYKVGDTVRLTVRARRSLARGVGDPAARRISRAGPDLSAGCRSARRSARAGSSP